MSMIGIGPDIQNPATAANLAISGKGFALGSVAMTPTGQIYIFVQAATALAIGDAVAINAAFTGTLLTTTTSPRGFRVGVVPAAFAVGERGWVQVYGPASLSVLASAAANARLNTTATGGALDDDATTGAKVITGVVLTTARGGTAGTAVAILNWPAVDATL